MARGVDIPFPKAIRLPAEAYRTPGRLFHVSIRAAPRTRPFADNELGAAVWETVTGQSERGEVLILAACLMPDHLHLVVAVRTGDVVTWVGSFKRFTTRQSWKFGIRGALWQPSFYDRGWREGEVSDVVGYLCRNPVEAGLAATPEDWPWLGVWTLG